MLETIAFPISSNSTFLDFHTFSMLIFHEECTRHVRSIREEKWMNRRLDVVNNARFLIEIFLRNRHVIYLILLTSACFFISYKYVLIVITMILTIFEGSSVIADCYLNHIRVTFKSQYRFNLSLSNLSSLFLSP